MADTEIVVQAQSTAFQRSGQTIHDRGYNPFYPVPDLAAIVRQAYTNSAVPNVTAAIQLALIASLLAQDNTVLPGGITLKNVQEIFPSAFNGADKLQLIYNKDPFSAEYETETRALYERQYDKARAAAQSGPSNVRGATARQAFELAALDVEMANNRFREIWQAQVAMAGLVSTAVNIASDAEAKRWGLQLQAQQQQAVTEEGRVRQALSAGELLERVRDNNAHYISAGAELLGVARMVINESLVGEGQQGSAQTTFGMSYWR